MPLFSLPSFRGKPSATDTPQGTQPAPVNKPKQGFSLFGPQQVTTSQRANIAAVNSELDYFINNATYIIIEIIEKYIKNTTVVEAQNNILKQTEIPGYIPIPQTQLVFDDIIKLLNEYITTLKAAPKKVPDDLTKPDVDTYIDTIESANSNASQILETALKLLSTKAIPSQYGIPLKKMNDTYLNYIINTKHNKQIPDPNELNNYKKIIETSLNEVSEKFAAIKEDLQCGQIDFYFKKPTNSVIEQLTCALYTYTIDELQEYIDLADRLLKVYNDISNPSENPDKSTVVPVGNSGGRKSNMKSNKKYNKKYNKKSCKRIRA